MGAFTHDKCAGKVRSIQAYHMDNKGWADIAYNFVVCPHGYVFEGRGWGKRSAANGTNICNDVYHAVCYLGGEGDPFTDQAKTGFNACRAEWARRYGRSPAVVPHSACLSTACPGNVIRQWIASGMGGGVAPAPAPVPPKPPGVIVVNRPPVKLLFDPQGRGYWVITDDGGVFGFTFEGKPALPFHGSLGGVALAQPIVDAQVTADGGGYILMGRDGGIFAFGNAQFAGRVEYRP